MEQLIDFQEELDFISRSDAEFELPNTDEIKIQPVVKKASIDSQVKAAYIDYLSYGSLGKQFDSYESFKAFYLSNHLI